MDDDERLVPDTITFMVSDLGTQLLSHATRRKVYAPCARLVSAVAALRGLAMVYCAGPPIFVSVLKREMPVGAELQSEIRRLTAAVAEICDRPPDTVHVLYEASAKGRLAFGGTLVE